MKRKTFLIILTITGIILYFFMLFNSFVWDDEEQVVNNALVHSLSNITKFFTGSTFNTGGAGSLSGMYYKPMMSTVFSIIYSIFGSNAFWFHLVQLIVHIANSCLVFLVFYNLFQKLKNSNRLEYIAFGLALIFLIHPINIETVAYISALQDCLFSFFGILSLLAIIKRKLVIELEDRKPLVLDLRIISAVLLLFSFFSKETGFIFAIIIPTYLYFFKRKELKFFLISEILILALYFFLRLVVADVGFSKGGIVPISMVSTSERLRTIPKILLYYLKTFFFPKDLIIAQHCVVKSINFKEFYLPLIIVSSFLVMLILAGLFLYKKSKKSFKVFLFFFLWLIISLSLHIQIFPLDMTVADRWFYAPIVGLLGCLGIFIHVFIRIDKLQKILIIIFLVIAIVLAARSFIRIQNWSNGLTLFSHDEKLNPDAFDLSNNLGVELYRNGQIDDAFIYFERSTQIAPYWWTNWNNLGAVNEKYGNLPQAEECYKRSIENGDYYLAYENYAAILIKQEKYDEAVEFLENEALPRFPLNEKLNTFYRYLKSEGTN